MKTCSNPECKQINPQPFSYFGKHAGHKDGLMSMCKPCERFFDNLRHKKYENSAKGKANHRRYLESIKGKANHCATQAKRRAAKIKSTPLWLTKNQHEQILKYYKEAQRLSKEMGIEHHVDHIEPLQGKDICGLHVPWNLQILIGPGPDGNFAKETKELLTNNNKSLIYEIC